MRNDINLIPDKILYRRTRILQFIGKILLGLFLAMGLFIFIFYNHEKKSNLEKEVHDITQKIDQSALKEISDMEQKLADKLNEKGSLEELLKTVPVPKIKVTALIKKITAMMPESSVVRSMSFDLDSQEVSFDMTFGNRKAITDFLTRLHDDPLFIDINISEIKEESGGLNFTLSITI